MLRNYRWPTAAPRTNAIGALLACIAFGGYDGAVYTTAFSRRIVLALGAAFVSQLGLWPPAAADELAETLADIYADHAVQGELPAQGLEPHSVGFEGAPWILWVALACIAVALLVTWLARTDLEALLARARANRRHSATDEDVPAGDKPDWFAAADALARQGRYAEAVHAVLLGALAALSADAQRWPTAATGREIAARHVRAADLGVLVAVAERAHFGGRSASVSEYRACRERAARLCQPSTAAGTARRTGKPGQTAAASERTPRGE